MQDGVGDGNVIVLLVVVPGELPVALPHLEDRIPDRLVALRRVHRHLGVDGSHHGSKPGPFCAEIDKDVAAIDLHPDGQEAVRYVHGNLGSGHFTYYGGHDPEDELARRQAGI